MDFKGYSVAYDYTAKTEKEKQQKENDACPILDDKCPYPWVLCEDCEVHCVMERANKKLEERNGN